MNGGEALGLLREQVINALSVFTPEIPVGIGWPPETQLADIARTKGRRVSIFDRAASQNVTRWLQTEPRSITVVDTHLTVTPALGSLSGVTSLVLGGSVTVNDALALVVQHDVVTPGSVVVIAGPTDTLNTMAAALASAINSDPTLSQWLSAVATGPQVDVTSNGDYPFAARIANVANAKYETRRYNRQSFISVWAATPEDRELVSGVLESALGRLSTNFGAQTASGDWVRMFMTGDLYIDDPILRDLYRRDFYVSVEYGLTYTDLMYPVLVALCSLDLSDAQVIPESVAGMLAAVRAETTIVIKASRSITLEAPDINLQGNVSSG